MTSYVTRRFQIYKSSDTSTLIETKTETTCSFSWQAPTQTTYSITVIFHVIAPVVPFELDHWKLTKRPSDTKYRLSAKLFQPNSVTKFNLWSELLFVWPLSLTILFVHMWIQSTVVSTHENVHWNYNFARLFYSYMLYVLVCILLNIFRSVRPFLCNYYFVP